MRLWLRLYLVFSVLSQILCEEQQTPPAAIQAVGVAEVRPASQEEPQHNTQTEDTKVNDPVGGATDSQASEQAVVDAAREREQVDQLAKSRDDEKQKKGKHTNAEKLVLLNQVDNSQPANTPETQVQESTDYKKTVASKEEQDEMKLKETLEERRFDFLKKANPSRENSEGMENLMLTEEQQQVGGTARVFLLISVGFAGFVWLLRLDSRIRHKTDHLFAWVKRKTGPMLPIVQSKVTQLLSSRPAFSLPKTKFSEMQDSAKVRSGSLASDPALLELKKMSLHGEYIPKMRGTPASFQSIVSESCMRNLVRHLPPRLGCKDWTLLFSTELHGYNLLTAYQKASASGPFVMVLMDMDRYVFGAFSSESLRVGDRSYYGTGESFIFQLMPNFRVHKWSGKNDQIIVSTKEMLAFGGGGKFALWIDPFLDYGLSEPGSSTFESYACLASEERFRCCAMEIWGFSLPSTSSPKRSIARTRKSIQFPKSLV